LILAISGLSSSHVYTSFNDSGFPRYKLRRSYRSFRYPPVRRSLTGTPPAQIEFDLDRAHFEFMRMFLYILRYRGSPVMFMRFFQSAIRDQFRKGSLYHSHIGNIPVIAAVFSIK
jgi:hypothetical protein